MDYFTVFDKKDESMAYFCLYCKNSDATYENNLCECCKFKYVTEHCQIFDTIAHLYDNKEDYDINFIKEERQKANILLNQLRIKYYGV